MPAAPDFALRRFQSAAAHYLAGRAPYPPDLIERTADILDLDGSDRLLDLGCGPAQLSAAFAPFVGEVLALDPEPAMLAVARKTLRDVPNAEIMPGGSEDLGPGLGRFRAVVIGRAFHWMDRQETLRRLDRLIEPAGAVVLFSDERLDLPENEWTRAYREALRPYAEGDERHPRKLSPPHISVLLDSAFSRLERISVIARHTVTVDDLVERALSRSTTSRARLGERADAMIEDIRAKAPAWSHEGTFVEVLASSALIAFRPEPRRH